MKKIILASASPRRKEILENMGISIEVLVSDADENTGEVLPEEYVLGLSRLKCVSVVRKYGKDDAFVIGADTIVVLDDKILGKPADEQDAFNMLKSLSGRTHTVYTGVTICDTKAMTLRSFCQKTDVKFYELSDDEIRDYIATGEPMDKAGAYGIQGRGGLLVEGIYGDYYNVVGLPVARLIRLLKD